MLTAQRTAGYNNVQLNAGVFLTGIDASAWTDAATAKTAIASAITAGTTILGMTKGGGTFTVTKELRSIEVDGKRNEFVGSQVIDSIDAQITTTLVEINEKNWKIALTTGTATTSGKVTTIKMNTDIATTDYIANLCWVGDRQDGGLIAIVFDNALNTGNTEFTFTDKGEGSLAVEFHAFQTGVATGTTAPFTIYELDNAS